MCLSAAKPFTLTLFRDLGLGIERNMDVVICRYRKSGQQGLYAAEKRLEELGIEWELK